MRALGNNFAAAIALLARLSKKFASAGLTPKIQRGKHNYGAEPF